MGTLHVPKAARPAWERLSLALLDYEPPCAADPGAWWSTDPADVEAAAKACRHCQVLRPCGEYANTAGERHGVWAGVDREPSRHADPAFFGGKKYSTVRVSDHLPPSKNHQREAPL